jgi:hypothetical protein
MSKVVELASNQVNGNDTITVDLIVTDETPAVVIVIWPAKATMLHPQRFPDAAAVVARLFAEGATRLAAIKKDRKL